MTQNISILSRSVIAATQGSLFTADDWRRAAHRRGLGESWRALARKHAAHAGAAAVMLGDDTIIIWESDANSTKLRQRTYRPGSYRLGE